MYFFCYNIWMLGKKKFIALGIHNLSTNTIIQLKLNEMETKYNNETLIALQRKIEVVNIQM